MANVELLFDQLHVLGFRAIAAYDGPSALQACFDHRPDLCILDVSMPAGDLGVDDRQTGVTLNQHLHFASENNVPVSTPQMYLGKQRVCDEDTDIGLRFALSELAPEVLK